MIILILKFRDTKGENKGRTETIKMSEADWDKLWDNPKLERYDWEVIYPDNFTATSLEEVERVYFS